MQGGLMSSCLNYFKRTAPQKRSWPFPFVEPLACCTKQMLALSLYAKFKFYAKFKLKDSSPVPRIRLPQSVSLPVLLMDKV
jgi:hypothetical protein